MSEGGTFMGLVMHYYERREKQNPEAAVLLAAELEEKRGEMSIDEVARMTGHDNNLSSDIRSIRGLYNPEIFVSPNLPALKVGDFVEVRIVQFMPEFGPHLIAGVIEGLADEQPFFDPDYGWQCRPFRMPRISENMRVSPSRNTIDRMKEVIIIGLQQRLSLSEIKYQLVYQDLVKIDPFFVDLMEMAFHGALGPALDQLGKRHKI